MPQQLTRKEKGCDDSCLAVECSHPACHEGVNHLYEIHGCEECGAPFCDNHLHAVHDYKLCGACLMEATRTISVVDVPCSGCGKHIGRQRLTKLQPEANPMECGACGWDRAFQSADRTHRAGEKPMEVITVTAASIDAMMARAIAAKN